MTHPHRRLARLLLLTSAALTAAACGEPGTAPIISGDSRVAITTLEQQRPALFVGSLDGATRTRVRFTGVTDSIPGNFADFQVKDANLLALAAPAFSPDGRRVAVVATLAFDQSEVVVMNADGTGGKVASVNSQSIGSDVAWSPDGTRVAYTMSTVPGFGGFDVFVTDVAANTVTRLTMGANVRVTAMRWSADGRSVLYAHNTGTASNGDWTSEVVRVDAATGASQVVASNIAGQISSIGVGGGRVLLTRLAPLGGTRQLIEAVPGTSERMLVQSDAAHAHYLGGTDAFALVVTATNVNGTIVNGHFVIDMLTGDTTGVRDVGPSGAVDVYYDALPLMSERASRSTRS
ncbi:MAG TPA: hypothetical protein VHB25_18685 [Gemmatimonadaceae bacterium]|nr:hypothetical protein [Gemmatimonadaceae bacterium]